MQKIVKEIPAMTQTTYKCDFCGVEYMSETSCENHEWFCKIKAIADTDFRLNGDKWIKAKEYASFDKTHVKLIRPIQFMISSGYNKKHIYTYDIIELIYAHNKPIAYECKICTVSTTNPINIYGLNSTTEPIGIAVHKVLTDAEAKRVIKNMSAIGREVQKWTMRKVKR